jgi:hypothetical protein
LRPEEENRLRVAAYRVDDTELSFLAELNEHLVQFERNLTERIRPSDLPMALIGGLQRSGTTLLYQLLARYCEVGYVNNLIARFWAAPLTGITLSRILLGNSRPGAGKLISDYGVTEGLVGPHEFGYFWSKWLRLDSAATHLLTDKESQGVDWSGLLKCLRQMGAVFGMPLLLKNPVACWNAVPLLLRFPALRLILVRRDPFFIVQSTYLARKRRYDDLHQWWSLKPPAYDRIRLESDPIRQIAAQVRDCEAVFDRLAESHSNRCITVDYQNVRQQTRRVIDDVSDFCGFGVRFDQPFPSSDDLPDGDRRQLSPDESRQIETALAGC